MESKWTEIKLGNYNVKFKKVSFGGEESHYCVYVLLPNSKHLHSSFLGNGQIDVSYRGKEGVDDDFNNVGIDTNHSWNEGMTMDERLLDGLRQINVIIKQYEKAMHGRIREEENE